MFAGISTIPSGFVAFEVALEDPKPTEKAQATFLARQAQRDAERKERRMNKRADGKVERNEEKKWMKKSVSSNTFTVSEPTVGVATGKIHVLFY